MAAEKQKKRGDLPSATDLTDLRGLVGHHIDSFNHFVSVLGVINSIKPVQLVHPISKETLTIGFTNFPRLSRPRKEPSIDPLYPFECRQSKMSYTGKLLIDVYFKCGDSLSKVQLDFGQFPIMLMSKHCNLRGYYPQLLVSHKEESSETGGYFIINGLQRVVRPLIVPKSNYAMSTNSFRDGKEGYADKSVVIRCLKYPMRTSVTVKLYYLLIGSARLGVRIQGKEFVFPVGLILKALDNVPDNEIFKSLTSCYLEKFEKRKVAERAEIILQEVAQLGLFTQHQCLEHIGKQLQPVMGGVEHKSDSDEVVGNAFLREYILVHLAGNNQKFDLLIFMLQKLFSLVDHTSTLDNLDSLQNQEVLLPGQLISIYLMEKLEDWLQRTKKLLQDEIKKDTNKINFHSVESSRKVLNKNPAWRVSLAIKHMLQIGQLFSRTGLELQQRTGFTVQAERLNILHFLSHFRAIHQGASFAGLPTTSVRKLLPESWGFLCPVHTPAGESCGLLNHMSSTCRITSYMDAQGHFKDIDARASVVSALVEKGMTRSPRLVQAGLPASLSVLLDGNVVGSIPLKQVEKVVAHLRRLKVTADSSMKFPNDLEVGYVPLSMGGAYPGLYLFSTPSRFVRPVNNISLGKIELIGPLEQVFMEIRCPDGRDGGRKEAFPPTHEEIHPAGMLSVVANLTPWSEHNRSLQNMYQCQMAKRIMGFSSQALCNRADKKLYHLTTPQSPIVRTKAYTNYGIDEYPMGMNALVAVLSYTGYDMMDAMILNKSSVDRGMFHGLMYQTESIDLSNKSGGSQIFKKSCWSSLGWSDDSNHSLIDSDGLPCVGQTIKPDEQYYNTYDEKTKEARTPKRKGSEPAIVDYVAIDGNKNFQKANIRFRHARNPVVGDMFSSRHGQKGVCSQLLADIDMPFSGVTGMCPDLIINPHAFPSRMTIAMLLESIAAKGGSLHGKYVDATPFANSEREAKSETIVEELSEMLKVKGFDYHGVEVLYSGVYGTELTCKIFIGPVYYQRLRVSDKSQVRATGETDLDTRQPVKGQSRGGGIRFGEMERDSLLAHGAAYLLHDRLHTCSDYHIADVCSLCGSILATSLVQPQVQVQRIQGLPPITAPKKVTCRVCKSSKGMETVAMPYAFRCLAAEFAVMNIKVTLQLSNGTGA